MTDFFSIFMGSLYKRHDFWGNLLEKSAFLASKLGNGPLLEHGPVIEILLYLVNIHVRDHK